jgi:hypothetical protein
LVFAAGLTVQGKILYISAIGMRTFSIDQPDYDSFGANSTEMKTRFLLPCLFLFLLTQKGIAQDNKAKDYRNFPVVVTLQFQAFAMPLQRSEVQFQKLWDRYRNRGQPQFLPQLGPEI